ncbi:MAG: PDZ domain-containing protein [Planctomycetia bacterium]|nr:PDZ domain-containing protein [Planctomycetia bacterium]
MAKSFGYDSTAGVLIGDVVADGPAAKAGLKAGDIVIQFNGNEATSANQFRNAIAATTPRTELELQIYRDGQRKNITVVIGQLDSDQPVAMRSGETSIDRLGMNVQRLTPELARQFGYDQDERGVVVAEVEPNGLADRVGIRPGDMIVAIGDKRIESVAAFRDTIQTVDVASGIRMQITRDGVRRFVFIRSTR